jgi:hypothetical protein
MHQVQQQPNTIFAEPGYSAFLNLTEVTRDVLITCTYTNASGVFTNTPLIGRPLSLGTYEIHYTLSAFGLSANATRMLTVSDTIPPVITLLGPSPLLWEARIPFADPGCRAIDAFEGDISLRVTVSGFVNVSAAVDSVFELTYTAADASNNRASVARTVVLVDRTPPFISLRGNASMVLEATFPFVDPGIFANDTVTPSNLLVTQITYMRASPGGNMSVTSSEPGVDSFVLSGTVYRITYTVTDANNNQNSTLRSVLIDDTIPPQLNLTGGALVRQQATEPFVDPGWTAFDALNGNLSQDVVVSGEVDTFSPAGTRFVLSYSVADAAGNKAVRNRTVLIFDDIPPVITLLGPSVVQLEATTTYVDRFGATAYDPLDGDINSSLIMVTNNVDSRAPAGSLFSVSYSVTDRAGNRAIPVNRSVLIVDTTAPTIAATGPAALTWQAGVPYTEFGLTAQDTLDGILNDRIAVSFTINTSGSITPIPPNVPRIGPLASLPTTLPAGCVVVVTSRVTDRANNTATYNRTLTIVDTLPPTINVLGPSHMHVRLGAVYRDAGATAWDLGTGNSTASLVVTVSPSPFSLANLTTTAGKYFLTYTAFDGVGNVAMAVGRSVVVLPPTQQGRIVDVSLSFDLAASVAARSLSAPVSQLAYFVPSSSTSVASILQLLSNRSVPVHSLVCSDAGLPVCTLDAPRLSTLLLKEIAENRTLTAAIAPFPLPVLTYMGALDCRPLAVAAGPASALLQSVGLAPRDVRCDSAGVCLFTSSQPLSPTTSSTIFPIRSVTLVPRISPLPRYRIQTRLRSDRLSAEDFVNVYALTRMQPTSISCVSSLCTVGTFGSTQDAYAQSLTSLSSYLTEATVTRFDTAVGSVVFSSPTADSTCQLTLLLAGIAPTNVSVSDTTCTFWAHDDVSDSQVGQLRALPNVVGASVDFAVTLRSSATATAMPRLFRGSVTAASESVARAALTQLMMPQPRSCRPSLAFDGLVACVIESTDPFSARLAALLTSSPAFRVATVPVQLTFSALFQEALRSQMGTSVCVCGWVGGGWVGVGVWVCVYPCMCGWVHV